MAPLLEEVAPGGDLARAVFAGLRAEAVRAGAEDLPVVDQDGIDPVAGLGRLQHHPQEEIPVLQPPAVFVPAAGQAPGFASVQQTVGVRALEVQRVGEPVLTPRRPLLFDQQPGARFAPLPPAVALSAVPEQARPLRCGLQHGRKKAGIPAVVGIQVGEKGSAAGPHSAVARGRGAARLRDEGPDARIVELLQQARGRVPGAIVDDQKLPVREALGLDAEDRAPEHVGPVPGGDDDGNERHGPASLGLPFRVEISDRRPGLMAEAALPWHPLS